MAKLEVKVFEKPLFPDKSIDKGVQSCVQPHEEPENPKCNYTFLKIGIGDHSVETSEKNKHLIIREVGGSSGNSVPVDISCIDPVGPCDEIHKTKALDFLDRSGNNAKLKNSDDSSASFNAHAYDIKDLELSEQLKFEKLKDRVYSLQFNTCSRQHGVDIHMYPKVSTSFKVGFEIEWDTEKNKFKQAFKIPIELKYTFDESDLHTLDLSSEFNLDPDKKKTMPIVQKAAAMEAWSIISNLRNLIENFSTLSDVLKPIFDVAAKGNSKPTMELMLAPSFEFEKSLVVSDNKFEVGIQKSYKISCDPIFKLEWEYDFSGKLLSAIPGVGPAIAGISWLLKECDAGGVFMIFGAGGSLKISGDCTNSPFTTKNEYSLALEGEVKIKLTLSAEINIVVNLWVKKIHIEEKAEAGAVAGIKVERKITFGDSIGLSVEFTGLKVYALTASKSGVVTSAGSSPEHDPNFSKNGLKSSENKKSYTIIDQKKLLEAKLKF